MSLGEWGEIITVVDSISITFHSISAVSALTTMILVAVLRKYQPAIGRTISFQLSFWIGVSDFIFHSISITNEVPGLLRNHLPTWFPKVVFTVNYFFPLWTVLLVACIALDLHLTYLVGTVNYRRFSSLYAPVSFLFTLIVQLPLMILTRTTWTPAGELGFYEVAGNLIVMFACCYALPLAIGIIYCFVIVVAVLIKLFKGAKEIQQNFSYRDLRKKKQLDSTLHMIARRLVLYPLIPIIFRSISIYAPFSWVPGFMSYVLVLIIESLLTSLQGMMNFLVFLLNPALYRAWYNFKRSLVRKYVFPSNYEFSRAVANSNFDTFGNSFVTSRDESTTMTWQIPNSMASGTGSQETTIDKYMGWFVRKFFVNQEITNDIETEYEQAMSNAIITRKNFATQ